jgi:hypothetical protein
MRFPSSESFLTSSIPDNEFFTRLTHMNKFANQNIFQAWRGFSRQADQVFGEGAMEAHSGHHQIHFSDSAP